MDTYYIAAVVIFLFSIVLLVVVSRARIYSSGGGENLVLQIGFGEEVIAALREQSNCGIKRLVVLNIEDGSEKVQGLEVCIRSNRTLQALKEISERLKLKGYLVFLSEKNSGRRPDKIGIIKGTDQYDIIRIKRTEGADHDTGNEDIINRLKKWDSLYGLTISGADYDWVEVEFKTLPKDIRAFAREIYDFCPDIAGDGSGIADDLADEITREKGICLYWN